MPKFEVSNDATNQSKKRQCASCRPNKYRASDNEKKLKQFIEKMIFSNQKHIFSSQTINLNDPCDISNDLYCKKVKFTLPVKSPPTKDYEYHHIIEIDCNWL